MKPFLFSVAFFSVFFLIACKKDINTSHINSIDPGADAIRIPNGPLLFASGNKTIHIVNATTGDIFYEDIEVEERPGVNISRAPAFINDSIAIVPSSNKMFCVNYTNKKLIWDIRFDTVGQPGHAYKISELCMNSSNVFMAYADYQGIYGGAKHVSRFFAVDIASGNINWAVDLLQLGTDYDLFSNPTCTEETVYLPVRNKLFAFDTKTGAMKWEFATHKDADLFNPAYDGEKIFVASNAYFFANAEDSVFALDLHSGLKLWSKEVLGLGTNPAPVIYKNRLFININKDIPDEGGVLCINASDGSNVWQYTRPYNFNKAPGMCPVFIDNDMLFASEMGHVTVYRLNIETGEKIWSLPTTSIYSTNQDEGPIAGGGMVYFKTTLADMHALNATDGSLLWKTHINTAQISNINAGPVLKDASGKFIYSSESGMQQ